MDMNLLFFIALLMESISQEISSTIIKILDVFSLNFSPQQESCIGFYWCLRAFLVRCLLAWYNQIYKILFSG